MEPYLTSRPLGPERLRYLYLTYPSSSVSDDDKRRDHPWISDDAYPYPKKLVRCKNMHPTTHKVGIIKKRMCLQPTFFEPYTFSEPIRYTCLAV